MEAEAEAIKNLVLTVPVPIESLVIMRRLLVRGSVRTNDGVCCRGTSTSFSLVVVSFFTDVNFWTSICDESNLKILAAFETRVFSSTTGHEESGVFPGKKVMEIRVVFVVARCLFNSGVCRIWPLE